MRELLKQNTFIQQNHDLSWHGNWRGWVLEMSLLLTLPWRLSTARNIDEPHRENVAMHGLWFPNKLAEYHMTFYLVEKVGVCKWTVFGANLCHELLTYLIIKHLNDFLGPIVAVVYLSFLMYHQWHPWIKMLLVFHFSNLPSKPWVCHLFLRHRWRNLLISWSAPLWNYTLTWSRRTFQNAAGVILCNTVGRYCAPIFGIDV